MTPEPGAATDADGAAPPRPPLGPAVRPGSSQAVTGTGPQPGSWGPGFSSSWLLPECGGFLAWERRTRGAGWFRAGGWEGEACASLTSAC